MIRDGGKYFLYRHIRLDTNQPFYIGIGQKSFDGTTDKSAYPRAFVAGAGRSDHWRRIARKTKYLVEILLESDDREWMYEKEREFITLYGRVDLGTGTLVNHTDGGEGLVNVAQEVILRALETKRKSGSLQRNREHLAKYRLPKGGRAEWRERRCFLYDAQSGTFIKSFDSPKYCGEEVGRAGTFVSKLCRAEQIYKRWFFTYEYKGERIDSSKYSEASHYEREVVQYSPDGLIEIARHKTAREASTGLGLSPASVSSAIRNGRCAGGFRWGWHDKGKGVAPKPSQHKWKSWKPILKIDPKTNEVISEYKSVAEAAVKYGVSETAISAAAKRDGTSCGFRWQYVNN